MKLFKYEGYKIVISEEALTLKPFKKLWDRDKSNDKGKALMELSFIYFFCDPRSDYQYLVDEEERLEAIKEGEGMSPKWKPDKLVQEAMNFYNSFKTTSALLLEDTRTMVEGYRAKLREITKDMSDLDIKEIKDLGTIIKQIPSLVKDLDEAEKALAAEMKSTGKMRGSGEKTIFEDTLDI